MMRLFRVAASALFLLSAAASDDISIISPQMDTPAWLASDSLSLALENSRTPGLHYPVLPLTQNMGLNGSANVGLTMNIRGDLRLAGQENYNQITGLGHIAYLCCDDADHRDNFNISPQKMLNQLMGANLSAIILYSEKTDWCSFARNDGPDYSSIVTMADKGDAADVLMHIKGKADNQTLLVSITGNATVSDTSNKGSSHSTVAMSVLYSITGLITLLFLAIIVTGTVRAHRHPERYGPRSGFGRRPRQSRAKGIARAVLDTLPIVKFGNDEHAKPDPDLELETAPKNTRDQQQQQQQVRAVATGGLGRASTENVEKSEVAKDKKKEKTGQDDATGTAGSCGDVAAATTVTTTITETATTAGSASARESTEQNNDHLGCSICTEDFTVGEDVRVLPCHHKFHPGCVDPWLVNVSGTCPLCRYDLEPGREEFSNTAEAATSELPPPLALEADDDGSTSSRRQRRLRLPEINRLGNLSPQERLAALREMRQVDGLSTVGGDGAGRGMGAGGGGGGSDTEESGRAALIAAKLRDKFRIRTRAQT